MGIDLGDIARDQITGFQGVVIGITKWLHGCERMTIQPRELKDGLPIQPQSFDVPQLELISKAVAKTTGDTGGPRPEPVRRHAP